MLAETRGINSNALEKIIHAFSAHNTIRRRRERRVVFLGQKAWHSHERPNPPLLAAISPLWGQCCWASPNCFHSPRGPRDITMCGEGAGPLFKLLSQRRDGWRRVHIASGTISCFGFGPGACMGLTRIYCSQAGLLQRRKQRSRRGPPLAPEVWRERAWVFSGFTVTGYPNYSTPG